MFNSCIIYNLPTWIIEKKKLLSGYFVWIFTLLEQCYISIFTLNFSYYVSHVLRIAINLRLIKTIFHATSSPTSHRCQHHHPGSRLIILYYCHCYIYISLFAFCFDNNFPFMPNTHMAIIIIIIIKINIKIKSINKVNI